MTDFSPLTRRILAVGLLVLMVLALINLLLVPLSGALGSSLARLADSRFRLERLEAVNARPLPPAGDPVPPGAYLVVPNRQLAADRAMLLISDAGARNGVQIGQLAAAPPEAARPQLVQLALSASGEETTLLAFIHELEAGSPLVRFERWTLQAEENGASGASAAPQPVRMTFTGTASLAWAPPQ